MINQFSRTTLLISQKGQDKLKNKHVLVFGCGGVGGNLVIALARSGLGNITIVDNDVVSLTNINRQAVAFHSTIGKYKVDVLEAILKDINPDINVCTKKTFYLPETSSEFDFTKYDYVIDAIDTVSAKIDIIVKCSELNVPIISAMGAGNKLDPTKLVITDIYKTEIDPLAKVMRHELKNRGIKKLKVCYSTETPIKHKEINEEENKSRPVPGSSAFVPPASGLVIASEVIKDLLERE